MPGGSDEGQFFCNYCGEAFSDAQDGYNHITREHAADVHVGPGERHPGRRARGLIVSVVGWIAVMVSLAVILFGFPSVMDEGWALPVVLGTVAGIVGAFVCGELYARKGVKREGDIVLDMHVDCDVCDKRMAWRDLYAHMEAYHPEVYSFQQGTFKPLFIVSVSLMVMGFVGMIASFMAWDSGWLSGVRLVLLATCSFASLFSGIATMHFFDKLYHTPMLEKAAEEWSERHPRSKDE